MQTPGKREKKRSRQLPDVQWAGASSQLPLNAHLLDTSESSKFSRRARNSPDSAGPVSHQPMESFSKPWEAGN